MASTYRSPRRAEQVRKWCRAALADWATLHETHGVPTALGPTHVVSLGEGRATCLYLPGTNFNAATSRPLLEALGEQVRVYAADLPGQPGLSSPTRPTDEVGAYGRWLSEVVEWVRRREGAAPLVVAGHSRGAAVALSADPDAVDAVALLSPAGLVGVRPSAPMLRATVPWLVRRNESGSARLLRYMSGPGHTPSPEMVEWMTLVARTSRTTGAPGPYPDAVLSRWRGHRVRIVVGSHDAFSPASRLAPAASSRLGVDLGVVEGAGHLLVDEEPHQVAAAVAELA